MALIDEFHFPFRRDFVEGRNIDLTISDWSCSLYTLITAGSMNKQLNTNYLEGETQHRTLQYTDWMYDGGNWGRPVTHALVQ